MINLPFDIELMNGRGVPTIFHVRRAVPEDMDHVMKLQLKSEFGSMNEPLPIEKEGKDLMIAFNPQFFIDALRVIGDEEVSLYMSNPKYPCFIRDDAKTYIYLILPVNF